MPPAPPTAVRRLHRGTEEEDATQLKLGHEFNDADTLTTSEAKLLIDAVLTQRPKDTGEEMALTEVMKKTQEYLSSFARFKTTEAIHAVERVLRNDVDLHKFEVAQLGSLCPEEAEEAKTLIPSLVSKKTDEDLQTILDELSTLRKFQ